MHAAHFTIPTAAELMRPAERVLSPEEGLVDATQALLTHSETCAPVTERERLIGALFERDCIRELAAVAFHGAPEGVVRDTMGEAVAVAPGDGLFQLIEHFILPEVRHVFVVDGDHRLLGLITRCDALRSLDALRIQRERAAAQPKAYGHPPTYDHPPTPHAKDLAD